ncbi:MAG: Gfo/Idh/MocA family oxidoreductase [bacterium]
MSTPHDRFTQITRAFSRREFVAVTGAAGLASVAVPVFSQPVPPAGPKVKLGIIGCGGRGKWIAGLFKKHGGYDFHAAADYFPEEAKVAGDELGIDASRRFSGLNGYKRLIESGVEAVALETPPYCLPDHATAAVAAGLHVYMAKPVSADVPGALAVKAAGEAATGKKRVFLVDYQMPTDPVNIEIASRIRAGGLGLIQQVQTNGICGGFNDPPLSDTIESRLRGLIWVNDIAIGCDYLGNFDIHAIDVALWLLAKRPIAASGASSVARPNAHGDAHGVCSVVFEYEGGVIHNHFGQGLGNNREGELSCTVHGQQAHAVVHYWGKSYLKGGPKHFGGGSVDNLYEAGASRNIAAFHAAVTQGDCSNPIVGRAVDGVLACILGREAAMRRTRLTLEEVIRENKRLEVNLKGLKE